MLLMLYYHGKMTRCYTIAPSHMNLGDPIVRTSYTSPAFPLPMMICCASARWKLPTETSVYGDKQWLFLILPHTMSL
jgi:hypothetical protein